MDKQILHSVLETVTAGMVIGVAFHEPFAELSGDYTVLQSKTGRGRGGSRVLELASVANPEDTFGALEIDGKQKALGTGTSEIFASLTVDGKVHGLEDPAETVRKAPRVKRAPKADAPAAVAVEAAPAAEAAETEAPAAPTPRKRAPKAPKAQSTVNVGAKIAKILGGVLTDNPNTNFKLTGKNSAPHITGDWKVLSFTLDTDSLKMECVDLSNAERTLSFDSSVDGENVKDAEVLFVS